MMPTRMALSVCSMPGALEWVSRYDHQQTVAALAALARRRSTRVACLITPKAKRVEPRSKCTRRSSKATFIDGEGPIRLARIAWQTARRQDFRLFGGALGS